MFIAHLPSGYLLSRMHPSLQARTALILLGSVLPDIDLLWAYTVAPGTHHHTLLPHRPALWAALALVWWRWPGLAAVGAGGLLHTVLDTIAGQIAWGWPLWSHAAPMVDVPARYDWWVLSFLTHWVFVLELAICAAAGVVWVCHRHPLRRSRR